jgi:type IV secretory pathway TrbF-like protein
VKWSEEEEGCGRKERSRSWECLTEVALQQQQQQQQFEVDPKSAAGKPN